MLGCSRRIGYFASGTRCTLLFQPEIRAIAGEAADADPAQFRLKQPIVRTKQFLVSNRIRNANVPHRFLDFIATQRH